jgi:hypothetical protein
MLTWTLGPSCELVPVECSFDFLLSVEFDRDLGVGFYFGGQAMRRRGHFICKRKRVLGSGRDSSGDGDQNFGKN